MTITTFAGMNVTVSQHATERRENWPVKRRSRRLHKKLTKLRGPQFSEMPCAIRTPFGLVVHPDVLRMMRAKSADLAKGGGE